MAATKSMSGAIEISVVARFELFRAACVCACVHVKALRGNADGSRLRGQETLPLRYTAPRLASCTEDSNISTTPPHSDHCCCCCCCWRTPAGGKSHNSRSGPPWLLAECKCSTRPLLPNLALVYTHVLFPHPFSYLLLHPPFPSPYRTHFPTDFALIWHPQH